MSGRGQMTEEDGGRDDRKEGKRGPQGGLSGSRPDGQMVV